MKHQTVLIGGVYFFIVFSFLGSRLKMKKINQMLKKERKSAKMAVK